MAKTSLFFYVLFFIAGWFSPVQAEDIGSDAYSRLAGYNAWQKKRADSDAERLRMGDLQKQKRKEFEQRQQIARENFKREIYGYDHLLPEHLKKIEERQKKEDEIELTFAEMQRRKRDIYEKSIVPLKSKEYEIVP